MSKEIIESCQAWVNVKDIKDNYILGKNKYIYMIGLLENMNIDNLKRSEKKTKAKILASNTKSNRKPFDILSIPQSVDMQPDINKLNELYSCEIDSVKRYVLSELMKQDQEIMMEGKCYEHRKYIVCYEPISSSEEKAKTILWQRMNDFARAFNEVNNSVKLLNKVELISLCNLFNNGETALMYKYTEGEDLGFTMI